MSQTIIGKFERLDVSPIGTSVISHVLALSKVYSNQKRSSIDDLMFFCFNYSHGYTPFFDLSLTNLLNKSKRKSVAFSIKLFSPYNIASSPIGKGEGNGWGNFKYLWLEFIWDL
jgi:hypothetical protein